MLEVLSFIYFILGIISPAHRTFFWALPAGFMFVLILGKWIYAIKDGGRIDLESFDDNDQVIRRFKKHISVRKITPENAPPEIKEKMDEVMKILKDHKNLEDVGEEVDL